jgi:type III secretory pathway component EscS
VLPASEYWIMKLLSIVGSIFIMSAWVCLVLFTLSIRGFRYCACCAVPFKCCL